MLLWASPGTCLSRSWAATIWQRTSEQLIPHGNGVPFSVLACDLRDLSSFASGRNRLIVSVIMSVIDQYRFALSPIVDRTVAEGSKELDKN
jgi:hypothetical protein